MYSIMISGWNIVREGDYNGEATEAEIGERTLEDYLPKGMSGKMSFPGMKEIRLALNYIKPDREGVYPVCCAVQMVVPGAPPFRDFFVPAPKRKLTRLEKLRRWVRAKIGV